MRAAHGDYETRSVVDLPTAGLQNYVADPRTEVIVFCYRFDDGHIRRWYPGQPFPDDLRAHIESGGLFFGHNCQFEWYVWNFICAPRYGWPTLKIEQCRCTMAMAYAMALPGSLERACAAVGLSVQKDMKGHLLMKQMCRPRAINPDGSIVWWDEPDKIERLSQYCESDVEAECALEKRLMPLSADEQALWVLDQKINDRGVYIDREAVEGAIRVVQAETDRLNAEMREATDNFVGFCTETARITKWVKNQGVAIDGIAKADVLDALADADTPPHVKRVLLLRQEAGKSSTAKLRKMIESASSDNRLRGMLQYHGAGTGRWAGRKVQLHNMPRPKIEQDEIEAAIEAMKGTA